MSHLILDTLATVPDLVAFAAHGVALAADNTPAANPDGSVAGSPGIGGFFATAALSLLVIILGIDMTRRTRRLRYRAQYAAAQEAEQAQDQQDTESEDVQHDAR